MAVLTFPIPTQLKNLLEPAASADAATKNYVDSALSSGIGLGAAGSNTQVQFNNAGTIGANSNFTFDVSTSILTVTGNIVGSNANLGNLVTANYVNVSSNLKAGNANLGNTVTANYFTGVLTTASQPNITTVGTLGNLSVTSNITGSNLTVNTTASIASLIVSGTANLGAVGNITVTGGTTGQFLTSNGSGGLSFTTLSATSISNGNSNVIVNANSNVAISAIGVANVVTANGTVVTITPTTSATSTITGALVVSGGLGIAGNIYGGNIISAATTLLRDNKNVPTFVSAATVPTNPKIGDEWYNTTNDVIYQYIYDGTNYNWVDVSTGFISANTSALAGTIVVRDANGNIYGNTLSGNSLVVSGTSNLGPVGNVTITGGTSGQYLQTNGSGVLTWTTVSTSSLVNGNSNIVINANSNIAMSPAGVANVLVASSTGVNVAGTLNATGNANVGNIGSNNAVFTGTLNATGNANVGNIGSNNAVFTGAVSVTGALTSGDHTVTGNLTVTGTTEYVNVTTLAITDPIVEQGGGANKAALATNDAKDRGTVLHYYTTTPVDAFMGWDNSNAEFSFGSNVTIASEVVTFNQFGNIRAGNANLGNLVYANYHSGNGSLLSSITGANVTGVVANATFATTAGAVTGANVSGQVANALVAGTVYTNAQPNITSVGTLTSLVVTGNITTGNANLGNLTTSNFFAGNGSLLSSITGANVTGAVAFATTANSVAGANVTGAVAFATTANAVAGANVSGQVANALVASTVYTNAQPNITSVGSLTSLTVGNNTSVANLTATGNVTLGAVSNLHITGGTTGQYLQTDGSGNLVWGTVLTSTLANGTSNIVINSSGNVEISAGGTANVLEVTSTGVNLDGNVTSNNLTLTAGTDNNGTTPDNGTLVVQGGAGVSGNLTIGGILTVVGDFQVGNIQTNGSITGNVTYTGIVTFYGDSIFASTTNSISPTTGSVVLTGGLGVGGNIYAGGVVSGDILYGNIETHDQPGITSLGTLTSLEVNGPTHFTNLGNITIDGGVEGYYLSTNGFGDLTWSPPGQIIGYASVVSVAKDEFVGDGTRSSYTLSVTPQTENAILVNIDGVLQQAADYTLTGSVLQFTSNLELGQQLEVTTFGAMDIATGENQIQYNSNGIFASSDNLKFDPATNTFTTTNTVTTNLAVTGTALSLNGANITVSGNTAGIFNLGSIPFGGVDNINIGLQANVTLGSTTGNVTIRGNLVTNNLNGNLVSSLATIDQIVTASFVNQTASIPVTTDTVISSFPTSLYRSAKYIITAKNDDGHQALEALVLHDNQISFMTVYGSLSTGFVEDIVTLTSNVAANGSVCIYATGSAANTQVNMMTTYVTD